MTVRTPANAGGRHRTRRYTYTHEVATISLSPNPLLTDGIRLLPMLYYGCMTRHDAKKHQSTRAAIQRAPRRQER
ncbi:hypothetical protein HRTV-28_gp19 [Halorubrum tailed virus 28]|uniref:Uncharacterized protein n=1 Tax=Halorubrum tailed virus 28 TaxID=2878009 RepID=A0AAE8XZY3_9CAUD|nr:hypothetical protein M1M39_gp20 [Halorubrum tailed virus 28]UBF23457.1 hypothetical protein HRTV-28_gp19 [Halorubrum tailed virus 28]